MCSASWLQIEIKRVTAIQVGIFLKKKERKNKLSENLIKFTILNVLLTITVQQQ